MLIVFVAAAIAVVIAFFISTIFVLLRKFLKFVDILITVDG